MYQLPPPTDDKVFELMIKDLFNAMYRTKSFQIIGRPGQSQDGIDVYSRSKKLAIQCKKKDIINRRSSDLKKELIRELPRQLTKAKKYTFEFENFILASTFKKDKDLEQLASKLSNDKITVEYWGWDQISEDLIDQKDLMNKYYSIIKKSINKKDILSRQAFHAANFVNNHLSKVHRGAILWYPNVTLAFGNDGYNPPKGYLFDEGNLRSLNEVVLFREKINKLKIKELAFSFGSDGYTWGMLLNTKNAKRVNDLVWSCYPEGSSNNSVQRSIAHIELSSYWQYPHTVEPPLK